MRLILLQICAFCLMLGCGTHRTNLALNEPIQEHPRSVLPPDTQPFEDAALKLYEQSEYIRALQFTYQAENVNPEAPGPMLLRGIIYEKGLKRPDLALLEYNRVLSQLPHRQVLAPLRPRLQHLYRLALKNSATAALKPGAPPPLEGRRLAVYPFGSWQNGKTQAALAIGISDMMLFDLAQRLGANNAESLHLYTLANAYRQTFPAADARAFAQWAGADLTISGTLLEQDNRTLALSIVLIDKMGQIRHRLPTLVCAQNNMGSLRTQIAEMLSPDLGLPSNRPENPPMALSPIALTLLAQGLDAYLAGDAERAHQLLGSALQLHPESRLLQTRYTWARAEWLVHKSQKDPFDIYAAFSAYPMPETAMARRLNATADVLIPSMGIREAQETITPFKPSPGESQ